MTAGSHLPSLCHHAPKIYQCRTRLGCFGKGLFWTGVRNAGIGPTFEISQPLQVRPPCEVERIHWSDKWAICLDRSLLGFYSILAGGVLHWFLRQIEQRVKWPDSSSTFCLFSFGDSWMNYVPTKSMVQFSDASFVVYLLTEGKVKGRFRWPIDNRSKMIVFSHFPTYCTAINTHPQRSHYWHHLLLNFSLGGHLVKA